MKKLTRLFAFCVVGLLMQVSTSFSAEVICSQMEITSIGHSGIWAKNVTGSSCGAIANGASQYFVFDAANIDRLLALSLTAMSLEKIIWLHGLGDVWGSIVDNIAVK
jgi:hypothetical protein